MHTRAQFFKGASPAALDLLAQMLRFDPRARITVEEALNHPFLRPVRRKKSKAEQGSSGPMSMLVTEQHMSKDEIAARIRREISTMALHRQQAEMQAAARRMARNARAAQGTGHGTGEAATATDRGTAAPAASTTVAAAASGGGSATP